MQDVSFIDAGLCLATRGPETAPETMVWAVLKYHCFFTFLLMHIMACCFVCLKLEDRNMINHAYTSPIK